MADNWISLVQILVLSLPPGRLCHNPRSTTTSLVRIASHLDLITTVAVIAIVIACAVAPSPPQLLLHPGTNPDYSYMLDMVAKAKQGVWLGRDCAFTYGPLYQALWALSAQIGGGSLGSFFRFGHLLPFAYTALLIFGFSALLLEGLPLWKRAVYVIALLISWTYFEVRQATVLFIFALCLSELERTSRRVSKLNIRAGLVGLALTLAFCISTDTGAYSLTAFTLAFVAYSICSRKDRLTLKSILRFSALVVGFFIVGVLSLRALLGPRFWRDAFATFASYRWAWALPFERSLLPWTVIIVPICLAVFAWGWTQRKPECRPLVQCPAFLISAPVFSLLFLQSSFIRADWQHVIFGLFPAIVFAAAILLANYRKFPGLVALAVLALCNGLYPGFLQTKISGALTVMRQPQTALCPEGSANWDGACFSLPAFRTLNALASYVVSHTGPSDSILVFPWENAYGTMVHRRIAGSVLQSYLALDTLVKRQIDSFEQQRPSLTIYSSDYISWAIDGVPSFTRSPETWFYLQSHYVEAAQIAPGLLILQRAEERARQWRMQCTELPLLAGTANVKVHGPTEFPILGHEQLLKSTDFLRLRMSVRYPQLWTVAKPWRLSVIVETDDGRTTETTAVIPPNRVSDLWISPRSAKELERYFLPEMRDWRDDDSRLRIKGLKIAVISMDAFSVKPLSIGVIKLESVQLALDSSNSR